MINDFEIDKEKMICVNCQYMQELLGKNPNDTFPCSFLNKMIKKVQDNSCPNWKKREQNNFV
jgi:hypothetical protein